MEFPKKYLPAEAPRAVRDLIARLLPRLVEGDHPSLAALREQLSHLDVVSVELSGFGFFAHLEVSGEVPLADPPNFAGGDAVIMLTGIQYPAGCVLFVRDGRLAMLEGYTCASENWPEKAEVVSIADVVPIHPASPRISMP